jgi:hypothetical protein
MRLIASRYAGCFGFVLAAALAGGCGDQADTPTDDAPAVQNDTPEAQLENVERRLVDALDRAKAAAGAGVLSRRQCSFKLLESESPDEPPTAMVTIETIVRLDPEAVDLPEPAAESPNGVTMPVSDAADEILKNSRSVTRRTYKLVYTGRHWELAEPMPEDTPETERMCFDLALSDG